MKVNFKKIEIQNFLSFGNNKTIFEYKPGINVVTGIIEGSTKRNGVGKSALLIDSLNFVLFGKPSRSEFHICKENLVNDINKKNCEVTIEFSIADNNYVISRGIKPNFLVIKENGKEIQFDSMKNTQKWIEDKLGITQTTFSNIIALNINTSKPFLALELSEKRKVIEDILSMNVYSILAESFKEKALDCKSRISVLSSQLTHKIKEKETHQENYEKIKNKLEIFNEEKRIACEKIEKEIEELTQTYHKLQQNFENIDDLQNQVKDLRSKLQSIQEKILSLSKEESKAKTKITELNEKISLLEHHEYCPVCRSHIKTNDFTQKFLSECKNLLSNEQDKIQKITEKIQMGNDAKEKIHLKILEIEKRIKENEILKNKIIVLQQKIESKKRELENEKNKKLNFDLDSFTNIIGNLDKEIYKIQDDLNNEQILFESSKIAKEILYEENGIKKYIFGKIIPLLNKKINEYLKIFGADYILRFNDNFEEIIVTSIGTERTYENFSSGEKKKLDLSVLLALTDIIKNYNSFDCNILILDEVVDTSLDSESVNSLFYFLKNNYIKRFSDKCVYIITHKNELSPDNYDRLVELKKSHNFTFLVNA